jgi:predicted dehydrogenase
LRITLAGLGAASLRGHLPALRQLEVQRRIELVGAADPDPGQLAVVGAAFPELRLFNSAEEMLESIPSDVFVVATQPSAHARLALLGAHHRQHVVCEKPLTLTRAHHELIRATFEALQLGLVSVHQYQYSSTWSAVVHWTRLADRLGVPFSMVVDVERKGTDCHAMSPWRTVPTTSGGMLADHGVHFLALASTISQDLEVLAGWRAWDRSGHERSAASLRVGSGILKIRVSAGGPARSTVVSLQIGTMVFTWMDTTACLTICGRVAHRWRVDALSDRSYVDTLYLPLYNNVIANLGEAAWRSRQKAEALGVSNVLVALLESTPTCVSTS